MNETKVRLEKSLQRAVSESEWRHLSRVGLVEELQRDDRKEAWQEFREGAVQHLKWLRDYEEDRRREQAGALQNTESASHSPAQLSSLLSELGVSRGPGSPAWSRAYAMAELSELFGLADRPRKPYMSSVVIPRGGTDGTQPQWVLLLQVELWMPAEEVKKEYQAFQEVLTNELPPPKTQQRAFEVAAFVWQAERVFGGRPSWPTLYKQWHIFRPNDKGFKDWRAFRNYFQRGAKATPPKYKITNEELTSQVRSGDFTDALDLWMSGVRASCASVVHQPE